jgi:hypothetical protein
MKRDTVLIALAIGLAIFLMRWVRAFTPIENYQIHFLPLFGIYWGLKLYFRKMKKSNPQYRISFLPALWLGIRMCLIASVFTGLLCFLFVQYPASTIKMFPALFLHSFPFISTAAYGLLITIICSAVFVYFKPIKSKPGTKFKLNTGQLLSI